ncbi:hypothetical protein ANCDUO_21922 [Ancylostoma duodenale]|uniref:Uncharacterized protein n=1 Tax=Ancylostoma duodenale TaxID=51022 RepID=A0A0C2CDT7_9BILA|nr:hypothetical protein ANCDUO_21922 [Ancylostoma duodenale]
MRSSTSSATTQRIASKYGCGTRTTTSSRNSGRS